MVEAPLSQATTKAVNVVQSDGHNQTTVPVSLATGDQLETVKDALDHPPDKPNLFATLTSIASAALVMVKAHGEIDAGKATLINVGLFSIAVSLGVTNGVLYGLAVRKKYPFHERARRYVQDMIELQGRAAPAAVKSKEMPLLALRVVVFPLGFALIAGRPVVAWPVACVLVGCLASEIILRLRRPWVEYRREPSPAHRQNLERDLAEKEEHLDPSGSALSRRLDRSDAGPVRHDVHASELSYAPSRRHETRRVSAGSKLTNTLASRATRPGGRSSGVAFAL